MTTKEKPVPKGFAGLSELVDRKPSAVKESAQASSQSAAPGRTPTSSQNAPPTRSSSATTPAAPTVRTQVLPEPTKPNSAGLVIGLLFAAVFVVGVFAFDNPRLPRAEESAVDVEASGASPTYSPSAYSENSSTYAAQLAADAAAAAADAAVAADAAASASAPAELPASTLDNSGLSGGAEFDPATVVLSDSNAAAPEPAAAEPSEEKVSTYTEERPPVGVGRVLSGTQLRYCVREKVRLDAADPLVDTSVESEVDRFNVLVDDYNSRCGSFQYPVGLLQRIEAETESIRRTLEEEGRSRFQ